MVQQVHQVQIQFLQARQQLHQQVVEMAVMVVPHKQQVLLEDQVEEEIQIQVEVQQEIHPL